MRVEAVSRERLVDEIVALTDRHPGRARLLVDGSPPTAPDTLARGVADELRRRGRAALVVDAGDFLRPASVRLEYGREDPDELLDRWLDDAALIREVLRPAAPDGSGQVLRRLWNPVTDRAYREPYTRLPPGGVLLVAGGLLLGRGLPAEATVHLSMSAAALRRTITAAWTLPAYERYSAEHAPESADLLVFADHPDRPAMRR